MKRLAIGVVLCAFLLQIMHTEYVYSQNYDIYEWTIEPKTDGSVHVLLGVTIGPNGLLSLPFKFSKTVSVESIKAWEAESGKSIDITETDKETGEEYEVKFKTRKGRGFQFFVEYTASDYVKNMGGTLFLFPWNWSSGISSFNTATIILPKEHELLYTDILDPVKVSSRGGQTSVVFEAEIAEEESFRFGIMFSDLGVQLLKDAENNFKRKKYDEAKKRYEDAIEFYSIFDKLYDRDKDDFLDELRERVTECETKAEVQTKEEAENLFNEGIDYFNEQKHDQAEAKFKLALAKFKELGDEEKVKECEDWISSCEETKESEQPEENGGGFCMGSSLILIALLGAALSSAFKR